MTDVIVDRDVVRELVVRGRDAIMTKGWTLRAPARTATGTPLADPSAIDADAYSLIGAMWCAARRIGVGSVGPDAHAALVACWRVLLAEGLIKVPTKLDADGQPRTPSPPTNIFAAIADWNDSLDDDQHEASRAKVVMVLTRALAIVAPRERKATRSSDGGAAA